MTTKELIQKAEQLKQPSSEAAHEYRSKQGDMLADLNDDIFKDENIFEMIGGAENKEMAEKNHSNHLKFMYSVFIAFDPAVLVHTVLWVYRSYISHGIKPEYWTLQIPSWIGIINSKLSIKTADEIVPFYKFLMDNHENFMELKDGE
ncbi:MAG: hypothetical protein HQL29_05585 [Candidatus Omnitrophica bacterium]|nr:hypothetical protein [Candidatus Omnitrophota bacterium]